MKIAFETDGLQQAAYLFCLRMKPLKSSKKAPRIRERISRVSAGGPLDESRGDALEGRATVLRDTDQPVYLSAAHRFHIPQRYWGSGNGSLYVIGAHCPGGQTNRTIRVRFVELKPARSIRALRIRIYGHDLEVNRLAELQNAVVRSHARMLTGELRCDPERFTHVFHSGRQGQSTNSYVVQLGTGHAATSSRSSLSDDASDGRAQTTH